MQNVPTTVEIVKKLDDLAALLESIQHSPPDALLDVKGLADYLNVSERQVETLIAEGHIHPLWIGGCRRFDRKAIDAYLRNATEKPSRRRRAAR